jgi:DDRGK domain-containing protein 1
VEEAGDGGEGGIVDEAGLLGRFVEYVKQGKVVVVEEVAAEFGLRTEEAMARLAGLEETGVLTGFFDDRGKFVYVSEEEMRAVAEFIQRRGRVSIPELAKESTRLLHLDAADAAA